MSRLLMIALLSCFLAPLLGAQSGMEVQQPCRIKELLNNRGWKIPGLSRSTVITHGRYKSEGVPDDVFIDTMESQAPAGAFTYVFLSSCDVAVLQSRSIDVTKIERFSMHERVFGYRITGVIAGFDEKGKRIHFGTQETVYFYDPTGSGKFTIMRYDTGELIFKIVVPDWVKQP